MAPPPQRTLGMRSVRILLECFRVVFVFTYVPVYLFVDFMFHLTLPFLKIYFNIFLQITSGEVFTARKRSLRRLCFYTCLLTGGGMCGSQGGACMVAGGACMVAGGGICGCQGGICGCQGACMVAGGGMCVVTRGHAWLPGACVLLGVCVVVGRCAWWQGRGVRGIRRDTVNERAVRILLECILVNLSFF